MSTIRKDILECKENWRKLAEIASKCNDFDQIRNDATTNLGLLESIDKFKFSVVGEWSSGKSTFINTLFFNGEEILPVGYNETTSAIIKISKGEKVKLSKTDYQSGSSGFIEIASEKADIKTKLLEYAKGEANLDTFSLEVNSSMLAGVEIIDTPGLNDTDNSRSFVTEDFINQTHGIIVLSKLDSIESRNLHNFIKEHSNVVSKLIFVINITEDDEDELDLDELKKSYSQKLKKEIEDCSGRGNIDPKVFCVNAKTGKYIDEFIQYLSSFVHEVSDSKIIEGEYQKINGYIQKFEKLIKFKKDPSKVDIDGFKSYIEKMRREFSEKEGITNEFIDGKIEEIRSLYEKSKNDKEKILKKMTNSLEKESESFLRLLGTRTSVINKKINGIIREANNELYDEGGDFRKYITNKLNEIANAIDSLLREIKIPDHDISTNQEKNIESNTGEATCATMIGSTLTGGVVALSSLTTTTTLLGSTALAKVATSYGFGTLCTTSTVVTAGPLAIAGPAVAVGLPVFIAILMWSTSKIKKSIEKTIEDTPKSILDAKKELDKQRDKFCEDIRKAYKDAKERYKDDINQKENAINSNDINDKLVHEIEIKLNELKKNIR